MAADDRTALMARRDRLIADYEWLRRMMCHLDMQTELLDKQLTELENLLPSDYVHPDDLPRNRQEKRPQRSRKATVRATH